MKGENNVEALCKAYCVFHEERFGSMHEEKRERKKKKKKDIL